MSQFKNEEESMIPPISVKPLRDIDTFEDALAEGKKNATFKMKVARTIINSNLKIK